MDQPVAQENVHNVSLTMYLDFLVQKIFHDLLVLSEILPRKNDIERKIEILNFAENTRKLLIKTSELIKWIKMIGIKQKCDEILNFVDLHSQIFINTADYMAILSRKSLPNSRLPKYLVKESTDILVNETYTLLPTCIKEKIVGVNFLDSNEKQILFDRIKLAINTRLVLEGIPPLMMLKFIKDGIVGLEVSDEFEITLTLTFNSNDEEKGLLEITGANDLDINDLRTKWHLLTIDFSPLTKQTSSNNHSIGNLNRLDQQPVTISDQQMLYMLDFLQNRLQHCDENEADEPPITILYQFLHSFAQSFVLETMYNKLTFLTYYNYDSVNCKIIHYRPNVQLVFTYWADINASLYQSYYAKIEKYEDTTYKSAFPIKERMFLKMTHYPNSINKVIVESLKEKLNTDAESFKKSNEYRLYLELLKTPTTSFNNICHSDSISTQIYLPRSISPSKLMANSAECFQNTDIAHLIEHVIRVRSNHKIVLLGAFCNILEPFEWDVCIAETTFKDPILQLKLKNNYDEGITIAVHRGSGLLKIDVPKYPDANGDLIPILQHNLNHNFHNFLQLYVPNEQVNRQSTIGSKEHLVKLANKAGLSDSAEALAKTCHSLAIILKSVRIYLLTQRYILSVQHLAIYININTNHFYHYNDPLALAYNYFITQIMTDNSNNTSTGSNNVSINNINKTEDLYPTLILLILNFSKFKAYHLIIKYIENANGYEIVLFLAFYPKYSPSHQVQNMKENSVLEIHKGKYVRTNKNFAKNIETEFNPIEEVEENCDDDSYHLLSHFITKFESLIPISEIARALQSTQEKNKVKNFYDPNMARIKHSQIIRIEKDSSSNSNTSPSTTTNPPTGNNLNTKTNQSASELAFKDVSFEYGLVLNFETRTSSSTENTTMSPANANTTKTTSLIYDTHSKTYFYNTFAISRAIFTIQGKTSRYWFVTLYLAPRRNCPTANPDPNADSLPTDIHENVYLQYFNIPYTKYQDVAECFFRDIKSILYLGGCGRFRSPSRSINNNVVETDLMDRPVSGTLVDVIDVDALVQYNYKKLTLTYGAPLQNFFVKVQSQDLGDCLKLAFTKSNYIAFPKSKDAILPIPHLTSEHIRNPHSSIKDMIEYDFNVNKYSISPRLLSLLDTTLPLLLNVANLNEVPFMDAPNEIVGKTLPHSVNFVHIPMSIHQHIILYRKCFGIMFHVKNKSNIVIKDYSSFDTSYPPLICLKKFLEFQHMKHNVARKTDLTVTPSDPEELIDDSEEISALLSRSLSLTPALASHIMTDLNKSGSFNKTSLEKYCGCLYVIRNTFEIIKEEENITLLKPLKYEDLNMSHDMDDNNLAITTFQFAVNGMVCQLAFDPKAWYEELTINFHLDQSKIPPQLVPILQPKDFHTIISFFYKKITNLNYKYANLVSFYRILNVPSNILRDCIEIMRLDLANSSNNLASNPPLMAGAFRWNLEWCLTIPPLGPILAAIGSPSVIVKNKMLFLLEFRSNPAISAPAQSLIIPLVYDLTNNLMQLADPTRFSNYLSNSPVINAINMILKRFNDFHCQNFSGHCSLYPAIKDLLINLVIPP